MDTRIELANAGNNLFEAISAEADRRRTTTMTQLNICWTKVSFVVVARPKVEDEALMQIIAEVNGDPIAFDVDGKMFCSEFALLKRLAAQTTTNVIQKATKDLDGESTICDENVWHVCRFEIRALRHKSGAELATPEFDFEWKVSNIHGGQIFEMCQDNSMGRDRLHVRISIKK